MSKLIDRLQKAAKGTLPPIGFGVARRAAAQPRMLLIASLDSSETEGLVERSTGADAVLIEPEKARPTPKNIQKVMEIINDIPWGTYLENNGDRKAAALIESGCDFLVFSAGNRISAVPQDEKTGKVMEVESSMDDNLLRTINVLPVDATLLTDSLEENGALVWHHLMIIQHVSNLLSKPLIVRMPANMTEPEIKALWDAGVDGVVVSGAEAGTLSELRKIMDRLPARARQKTGKLEALLPRATGTDSYSSMPDEEEEEDE